MKRENENDFGSFGSKNEDKSLAEKAFDKTAVGKAKNLADKNNDNDDNNKPNMNPNGMMKAAAAKKGAKTGAKAYVADKLSGMIGNLISMARLGVRMLAGTLAAGIKGLFSLITGAASAISSFFGLSGIVGSIVSVGLIVTLGFGIIGLPIMGINMYEEQTKKISDVSCEIDDSMLFSSETNYSEEIAEIALRELKDQAGIQGGKKYKDWYGMNADWCGMFVSYCVSEAGYATKGEVKRFGALASGWVRPKLSKNATWDYYPAGAGSTPRRGDIVYFNYGHVGVVVEVNGDTFSSVEGNTNSYNHNTSVVARHDNISITNPNIGGFLHLMSKNKKGGAKNSTAQLTESQDAFIKKIGKEARALWKPYHIYPSTIIAQACLESAFGTSNFARERNNLFGIGAYDSSPNSAFRFTDAQAVAACPKTYWSGASNKYWNVINSSSGREQMSKLGNGVWATDPNYSKKLLNIADKYNLYAYDKGLSDFKPDKSKFGGDAPDISGAVENDAKDILNSDDGCGDKLANMAGEDSLLEESGGVPGMRTKSPPHTGWFGSSKNPFPFNHATGGNCTWYAYGRFCENLEAHGKKPHLACRGDAVNFWEENKRAGRNAYKYGSKAKPGSIMVWGYGSRTGHPGHVAFVEKVLPNGDVITSESGWSSGWLGNIKRTKASGYKMSYNNAVFLGFIYPND